MDNSSASFDITVIDSEDTEALAQKIEGYYKKDSTQKTQLAYYWERNQLMLDGKQWLVFDGEMETGGIWKRLNVSRANEYIPRPVTNYLFDIYQTLKSYLIKNKPRSQIKPNTQTYKDKSAAKIGELVLETNWERLKEEFNYEYAASNLITYGTVFKKSYWDTSSLSMVRVPRMVMQPKSDPQTGAIIGEEEIQAIDEEGLPIFDELPLGDVATKIVEPFRMCIDPLASDLYDARWVMEYSIQPLAWIKEVYGKEGDGYTGEADNLTEETQLSGSMRRFYQLKNSSGVKNRLEGLTTSGSEEGLVNSAIVKEYYERPSRKYPKGRMIVVANNKTLYAGESPYSGPEQGDWHPYSECRWEIMPGRFWGKGPLDNACEVQRMINAIDSVVVLIRKTTAVPQKLIPHTSGIAHGSWTGRPGQMVFYRDTGGSKPETLPGVGADPSLFQERAQRLEDLKNITGAIDILKGDRPEGVTAASALEMLYEVGTGKLFPISDRWKKFVESDQKKQLRVTCKFYREPRKEFIDMLKSKNTELTEQAITQFIGDDLNDNCNVIVEAGSNIPKLLAARKAALMEAAQVGVLGLEDPSNRIEFLSQMGIPGFDSDVGMDVKRAEWENDLLDNVDHSPDNRPIVLYVDNDEVHIEVLSNRMKEPSFMSLSANVQQAYMQHLQEHEQQMSQKKMSAQMEAMASGQPPQQPAPTQQPVQPAGKGPSSRVRDRMSADLKIPGESA